MIHPSIIRGNETYINTAYMTEFGEYNVTDKDTHLVIEAASAGEVPFIINLPRIAQGEFYERQHPLMVSVLDCDGKIEVRCSEGELVDRISYSNCGSGYVGLATSYIFRCPHSAIFYPSTIRSIPGYRDEWMVHDNSWVHMEAERAYFHEHFINHFSSIWREFHNDGETVFGSDLSGGSVSLNTGEANGDRAEYDNAGTAWADPSRTLHMRFTIRPVTNTGQLFMIGFYNPDNDGEAYNGQTTPGIGVWLEHDTENPEWGTNWLFCCSDGTTTQKYNTGLSVTTAQSTFNLFMYNSQRAELYNGNNLIGVLLGSEEHPLPSLEEGRMEAYIKLETLEAANKQMLLRSLIMSGAKGDHL